MKNDDIVEISGLNNEELVTLYEKILEHIKFINDSIIEESDGNTDE